MKNILILLAALSVIACSKPDCDNTCKPRPPTFDERLSQLESQVDFLQHRVDRVQEDTGSIVLPGQTHFDPCGGQPNCTVAGPQWSPETAPLADIVRQIMARDGLTLQKTPAVKSSVDVVPQTAFVYGPTFATHAPTPTKGKK